jgi:hypothetical protein
MSTGSLDSLIVPFRYGGLFKEVKENVCFNHNLNILASKYLP